MKHLIFLFFFLLMSQEAWSTQAFLSQEAFERLAPRENNILNQYSLVGGGASGVKGGGNGELQKRFEKIQLFNGRFLQEMTELTKLPSALSETSENDQRLISQFKDLKELGQKWMGIANEYKTERENNWDSILRGGLFSTRAAPELRVEESCKDEAGNEYDVTGTRAPVRICISMNYIKKQERDPKEIGEILLTASNGSPLSHPFQEVYKNLESISAPSFFSEYGFAYAASIKYELFSFPSDLTFSQLKEKNLTCALTLDDQDFSSTVTLDELLKNFGALTKNLRQTYDEVWILRLDEHRVVECERER